MTRQMKKLTGKCPVTDCYREHWHNRAGREKSIIAEIY